MYTNSPRDNCFTISIHTAGSMGQNRRGKESKRERFGPNKSVALRFTADMRCIYCTLVDLNFLSAFDEQIVCKAQTWIFAYLFGLDTEIHQTEAHTPQMKLSCLIWRYRFQIQFKSYLLNFAKRFSFIVRFEAEDFPCTHEADKIFSHAHCALLCENHWTRMNR